MRKLACPIQTIEAQSRKPMPKPAPLLEEGGMAKMKEASKAAVKTEVKRESKEPKKKGLSAKQYAAILSFVMLITAIVSQGAAILGCARSAVEQTRDAAPLVGTADSFDKGDSQSNVSLPMIAPKPPMPDSVKPVPNPNSRLNQSLP